MRRSTLILILVTIAVFGRVCGFGFTNAEDEALITHNPHLNPPTLSGLAFHWEHPHIGLYIPVTYTAWWMLARAGQTQVPDQSGARLNPWLFHSFNLLMHVLAGVMVLSILRRLKLAEAPALIGALLFTIHPLQVEAVAWTTGTKDVLSGFLVMAAIHQYIVFAQQRNREDRRRNRRANLHYAIATFCFVLAMLAKPAAVVAPFLVAIIDRWLLWRSWKQIARSALPWLVLTIPILAITRIVQPATEVIAPPIWARPLVAADALVFYLSKLVWPFKLTMAYGRSPKVITASGAIYWTWIILVIVGGVIAMLRRRWLTAGALIFIAGVLPVLGLTTFTFQQFSTVADRYMYLSMLGVAIAAAYAVSLHPTRAIIALCTIALILLGMRSFNQAGTWSDRLALYRHAVEVAPSSYVAQGNLAVVLSHQGDDTDAIPHAARAVELEPRDANMRLNYASILESQHRYAEAARQLDAVEHFAPSPQNIERIAALRKLLPATRPAK